ncbi:hypothetical protein WME99_22715 [Sorangium sp. So ce136]|uniref:hypothetical protein n=1 Tax=Sorangium sp. So ce136 TaxID=3133284 RepID=UPI003F12094F
MLADSVRLSASARSDDDFQRAALLILFARISDTLDGRDVLATRDTAEDDAGVRARRQTDRASVM